MTPAGVATQRVEVGAVVRITAPGSRETNGEARVIPAMVTHQWPDGSLELCAFHLGSPQHVRAIKPEMVEMVMSRNEFDLIFEDINKRMTELENQIVALGGRKYDPPTKFAMADG